MTASKELLERLHEAVGEQLLAKIESGEAKASDFAQAIKFLSDNGIEAIPTDNNALNELAKATTAKLPFSDPDEPLTYQ
jgi:hypothetical protein